MIPGNPSSKLSRRGFLVAVTGSAIAAAAGCRPNTVIPPTPYIPGSTPLPAGTPNPVSTAASILDAKYGNVTFDKIILTSMNDLYVTQYDYARTPDILPEEWSLKVDGLVDNPVNLDYAAIKKFPVYEDMRTLECIGNPVGGGLIGNLMWKGFRFSEILKLVKPKATATHLKFECADGYSTSVELKWVQHPDTLLAYEMNGEPLTVKHGFPLRISTPGLYGQKMPRWITHLEFIDQYYRGFWESRGWSDVANVQTNSIIKTPETNYTTQVGSTIALQGVAFASPRKIMKVEVQADQGEWMPAKLTAGQSPFAWTQWYLPWKATAPGVYRIGVRATDDTGFVQSNEAGGVFGDAAPNGTSAIHRVVVEVS